MASGQVTVSLAYLAGGFAARTVGGSSASRVGCLVIEVLLAL